MKKSQTAGEAAISITRRDLLSGRGAIAGMRVRPGLRAALAAAPWDLIVVGAGATTGNALLKGIMVTPALTFGRPIGQRIAV